MYKKIVLIGRPCDGKTTALNYIPEKLADYGWAVISAPEIATILITSGIAPIKLATHPSRKVY